MSWKTRTNLPFTPGFSQKGAWTAPKPPPTKKKKSRKKKKNSQNNSAPFSHPPKFTILVANSWQDPSAVMPIFPLTGAYFPFSEMELSIFEPRWVGERFVDSGRSYRLVASWFWMYINVACWLPSKDEDVCFWLYFVRMGWFLKDNCNWGSKEAQPVNVWQLDCALTLQKHQFDRYE